jgi:hypothetical protein
VGHDRSGDERFNPEEPAGERRTPGDATPAAQRGSRSHQTRSPWYLLFLLPFFGTFFPWIFNTRNPELFGMPFFYWYQMAWLPLSVIITIVVYRATRGTVR